MNETAVSLQQSIDETALSAPVRRSLGSETLRVVDWHASRIGGGVGNPVSVGLYRYEGTAQNGEGPVRWSLILKVIQSPANTGWTDMGEGEDPAHWNYWRRELFAYRSRLLEVLPADLRAPRCFGTGEAAGNVAWLWLEDIHDSYGGAWPLPRYALAARHLGRLNGLFGAAPPLSAFPWLGDHLTRQWLASEPALRLFPWDHPRAMERYPGPERNFFRRMLDEIERFQARLDRLPQVLCHGDTYPTNLMSVRTAEAQEQTVALDWALVGIGPAGDDLGQLVFGAQAALPGVQPQEVVEALFKGYIDGLQEGGCYINPRWVRFGFNTSAALRVGLFRLRMLWDSIESGEAGPAEPAEAEPFEVAMAREAYEAMDSL